MPLGISLEACVLDHLFPPERRRQRNLLLRHFVLRRSTKPVVKDSLDAERVIHGRSVLLRSIGNHDSEECARQSPDCSSRALGIVLSAEISR
jgi:hypothetical protein